MQCHIEILSASCYDFDYSHVGNEAVIARISQDLAMNISTTISTISKLFTVTGSTENLVIHLPIRFLVT